MSKSIEEILGKLHKIQNEDLRKAIRNNGGGFVNHNLWWRILTPNQVERSEWLTTFVEKKFGTFNNFTALFTETATKVFGSGWVSFSLIYANDQGVLVD